MIELSRRQKGWDNVHGLSKDSWEKWKMFRMNDATEINHGNKIMLPGHHPQKIRISSFCPWRVCLRVL